MIQVDILENKWVKSAIIKDEIDQLKSQEEFDKNKVCIEVHYVFNEKRPVLTADEYFPLESEEELNLKQLRRIFMARQSNKLNFILIENYLDGDIICLEAEYKMSIMIRLDQTRRRPTAAWFWKYREK